MTPRRRPGRDVSMTTVMLAIALVPTIVMLIVISVALYVSRSNEIRTDLAERGTLIAAALAETSTYGVVSGNAEILRSTMRGLLAVDRSIASAEVLDEDHRLLATVESSSPRSASPISFERPIRSQPIEVDVFADPNTPHLSQPATQGVRSSEGRVLGFARVVMSLEPLADAKWRYLRITLVVLVVSAGIGLALTLLLLDRLRKPIALMVDALRRIRNGQYEISVGPTARGEVGELQDTIVEVAQALYATTSGLEATVAQRTAQLHEAVELANRSNEEKRDLIAGNNRRLEEERRRISLEIHDSMNSTLLVVRLKAQHIEHLASNSTVIEDAKDIAKSASDIANSVETLYVSARDIVKQLRPEIIDMLGLVGALAELVRTYDEIHPDCHFVLNVPVSLPELQVDFAITAYRLVQESLSNVVKHSSATFVRVDIDWNPLTSIVVMTITDNGIGFDPAPSSRGGLGLIGMRERVFGIGGTMGLQTANGAGTSITFTMPVQLVPLTTVEANEPD